MAVLAGGITLDTAELDRIRANVMPRAEQVVAGAAFAVEGRAKTLAPVDTGFLKSSIGAERQSGLSWLVWAYAEYALYVEVGTSRMAAQPYMIPALEQVYPEFVRNWRSLFE